MTKKRVVHASVLDNVWLCGAKTGRETQPQEAVDCVECQVILNHLRQRYPQHADYTDWRLTPSATRSAVRDMRADLIGEIEG